MRETYASIQTFYSHLLLAPPPSYPWGSSSRNLTAEEKQTFKKQGQQTQRKPHRGGGTHSSWTRPRRAAGTAGWRGGISNPRPCPRRASQDPPPTPRSGTPGQILTRRPPRHGPAAAAAEAARATTGPRRGPRAGNPKKEHRKDRQSSAPTPGTPRRTRRERIGAGGRERESGDSPGAGGRSARTCRRRGRGRRASCQPRRRRAHGREELGGGRGVRIRATGRGGRVE